MVKMLQSGRNILDELKNMPKEELLSMIAKLM